MPLSEPNPKGEKPYVWLEFPCCGRTYAVEKPNEKGEGEWECPECGLIVKTQKKAVKP